MEDLGYELIDLHEHEFQKNGLSVEYGSIDFLYDFAGIRVSDLDLIQVDGINFRLPTLRQFLKIYKLLQRILIEMTIITTKILRKLIF